jgi:autotransporter-associated beta strand protein
LARIAVDPHALQCRWRSAVEHRQDIRHSIAKQRLKRTACAAGLCAAAGFLLPSAAFAGSDINAGSSYLASNLGGSVNAVFNGGTLVLDESKTIGRDFTVNDVSTNTIDIDGNTVIFSGDLTGDGPLTITDNAGGGSLTLTGDGNDYSGWTTISGGAVLALEDSGTIAESSGLTNNGTFDISGADSSVYIVTLDGSGSVILGEQSLGLSSGAGTFSGTISGTGGLALITGGETLTGVNTYTGYTTITSGTLTLSGSGSIAESSNVIVYGTLDVSSATAPTIKSLSGSGNLTLGSQTLTLTAAVGTFSGVIDGTGGLNLNGGIEYLKVDESYTGLVTVNAGTLDIGSETVNYDVVNSGTVSFYNSTSTEMNGAISGTGAVSQIGSGATTVTAFQPYTGPTTISSGKLVLSGSGSIANSSKVTVDGTFDISDTAGASIVSLAGSGTVVLGAETLTLTNASDTFSGSITGTGDVILADGAQTLSGSSSFTGTTTIASGTLILRPGASLAKSAVVDHAILDVSSGSVLYWGSASIASLDGDGAVTLGANTLILKAAAGTFSGTISGTGNFTVNGGTEILSGANTYTGTTTVGSGANLVLSATGSLDPASSLTANGVFDATAVPGASIVFASLSGSGTVKLGAHGLTLTNATGVFSGAIQGSGGLVVEAGTQTLTGTSSYAGGTVIDAGATLQFGNRSAGGAVAGDILDNGTLAFDRSDVSVFSGAISGSGAVIHSGTGTTILTAENTYTGGTTIAAGTMQVGGGGTSGSIVGDVTDNGILAFGRSDSLVFDAVISGTGGVKLVSGATILTAVESYTGATTINSGATLSLGGAGSIETSRLVTDNGTFDVSGASAPRIKSLAGGGAVTLGSQTLTLTGASGAFGGAISGSGGLTLSAGTQTLSGASGYTGATTIDGGTLAVNGSIAGSSGVTVNSGGTLAGTGTVSSVVVNSGGTLAPGSSGVGTLTVNGDVTFASGSTYVVGTGSSSATILTATGSASLAGTLGVDSADGTYLFGQKQTVLTAAGGVTGSFTLATPTTTGADFSSVLTYDAQHVYLEIDLARLSPLLPSDAGANAANAVAAIDDAIAAGDTLPQAFEDLGNVSSATLADDAAQMAGEIGGDLPRLGATLLTPFLDTIFSRIENDRTPPGNRGQVTLWTSAFATTHSIAADAGGTGAHKFRTDASGFVAGANWTLSQNHMLGAAISAGSADFRLAGADGTGDAGVLQAGLYGYARFSPHFYGSFAAAVALADIATRRTVTVSGSDVLEGKLTGIVFGGRYETGVILPWATPYVAFEDVLTMLPSYGETASSGSFALRYADSTANTGRLELGFRQSVDVTVNPEWILTPNWTLHLSDRFAWAHDFFGASGTKTSFAALPSSEFTVYGAEPARDSVLVTMGAEFQFEGGLRLDARLDTAFSANVQSFTGTAGVSYTW